MAKKAPASSPSRKAKPAASRKAASRNGRKPAAQARPPAKVSSGRGPTPAELGQQLVERFNQGKADEWIKGVWHKGVRSIEGDGMLSSGVKEVLGKWQWWFDNHEVLGASAEGPYVGATGFAVKFQMHIRMKQTGGEMRMTEVAVYTVKDGRIVQEEFMYGQMG